MTLTAIDAQALTPPTAMGHRASPDQWEAWEPKRDEPDRSFFEAFAALQKLHKTSSTIRFAELPTEALPTADDVMRAVLSKYSATVAPDATRSWDVEIDLPVWKGPPSFRTEGIVRKVRKPKFRPITEDDMGGV
jgi:hypothetical protein